MEKTLDPALPESVFICGLFKDAKQEISFLCNSAKFVVLSFVTKKKKEKRRRGRRQ